MWEEEKMNKDDNQRQQGRKEQDSPRIAEDEVRYCLAAVDGNWGQFFIRCRALGGGGNEC